MDLGEEANSAVVPETTETAADKMAPSPEPEEKPMEETEKESKVVDDDVVDVSTDTAGESTPINPPPPQPTANDRNSPGSPKTNGSTKNITPESTLGESELAESMESVSVLDDSKDDEDESRLLQDPVDREMDVDGSLSDTPLKMKRKRGNYYRGGKKARVTQPEWLIPFDMGWTREVVFRGTAGKNCDVYYKPPMGKKCRSMIDVEKFLTLNSITKPTIDCFTFGHFPIYKAPFEIVRSAKQGPGGGRGRGASNSPRVGLASSPNRSISPASNSTPSPVVRAVAKKSTSAKRGRRPKHPGDSGSMRPVGSRPSIGASRQRLCGLDCPGKEGVPPSVHCEICMCMFHPDCVNYVVGSSASFKCKSCSGALGTPDAGSPISSTSTPIVGSTASLLKKAITSTPSSAPKSTVPPPPPLRAAPTQAPPARSVVRPVNGVSPPTVTSGASTEASVTRVSLPPNMSLNQISGQLLSLPTSVTHKLDTSKSLSLKVNNQRFVVPPSCFISTPEGIKVFLPAGSLPPSIAKGPTTPVDLNVTKKPQGEVVMTANEPSATHVQQMGKRAATSKRFSSGNQGPNPALCHMNTLHAGFESMLAIFSYLSMPDLLRVSRVCKTWRSFASQPCLWETVTLRGVQVTNWKKAADFLYNRCTHKLDIRGCTNTGDDLWLPFSEALGKFCYLRRITLGTCPLDIAHKVIDACYHLEAFSAEIETDNDETKLDVSRLSKLTDAEELCLQGTKSIILPPEESYNLNGLAALTNLKKLSLTTLRHVPESQFKFLGSLTQLKCLEIGDCLSWGVMTHEELSKLHDLTSLRLEGGGNDPDLGLGDALQKLAKLENLELIKYHIDLHLAESLSSLKHLKTLYVSPYSKTKMSEVNSNTMRGVRAMSFLRRLDWGLMPDRDANRADPSKGARGIPFLAGWDKASSSEVDAEGEVSVSINKLVETLCGFLCDTTIRAFRLPVEFQDSLESE